MYCYFNNDLNTTFRITIFSSVSVDKRRLHACYYVIIMLNYLLDFFFPFGIMEAVLLLFVRVQVMRPKVWFCSSLKLIYGHAAPKQETEGSCFLAFVAFKGLCSLRNESGQFADLTEK